MTKAVVKYASAGHGCGVSIVLCCPKKQPMRSFVLAALGPHGHWAMQDGRHGGHTPEAKAIRIKCYEMLLDHRISAYGPPLPEDLALSLSGSHDFAESLPHRRDERVTVFMAGGGMLEQVMAHGLAHKAYFQLEDEPYRREHYADIMKSVRPITHQALFPHVRPARLR